jgi:putative Holliday junction resolvase
MRYLAIDYGNRRTGLAVCDPAETIVSPLSVLPTADRLIEDIAKIIADERIEAVVIGMPLNMDDTAGPQAKRVADFAAELEKCIDVPIHLQDERLTTFAAKDKLADASIPAKKKREMIDALAAAEILNVFLDSRQGR